jgi:DMSO/TMAO reductase YedYZ heme-binding membrane subunit
VPTTVGRARGRQSVRSGSHGAVGEHFSKIMMTLITGVAVIVFALVMTKPGRDIDAATQHFMLYYAGVFALIGLAASVAVGLVATDRIVMTPGHRVMAQAVHRAVSFGALAFLVIHIVSEILAQRVHVIDSVIPFLSPYRTFYIGLGTISSDLILFIVITSIVRKRFTAHGKAWRWRAIHYGAYLAFVFGVLHGLLGGRAAKPYVDWSYGFVIALTALALVVRFLAISLRPKERVGAHRGADRAVGGLGYSAASPLRTAALHMAQAQLGGTIQIMPAPMGGQGAGPSLPGSQRAAALPAARGWPSSSGPLPALSAAPAYVAEPHARYEAPDLMPLSAPVYREARPAGTGGYPYAALDAPQPPGGPVAAGRPWHEPEYDGPPRFVGTPRRHVPQDDLSSYPYSPASFQPGRAEGNTGPMPRVGPDPRRGSGPMPRVDSGPMPRLGTGPMPRVDSGPMPRLGTGPVPRVDTGPVPRRGTGPMPRVDSGPMPRLGTGPMPRADSGPMPRLGTGPMPGTSDGSVPGTSRPAPWPGANPDPRAATGPMPAAPSRRSGSADPARPRTRDVPGRAGGDEWK